MGKGNTLKAVCFLLACMAVAAPMAEAYLPCSTVTGSLGSCLGYLRGIGRGGPSGACCMGLRRLSLVARTPADRREACFCLQRAARSIRINYSLAASLPRFCRVNIPYQISPRTNCNIVR